jgi:hypothetical protein
MGPGPEPALDQRWNESARLALVPRIYNPNSALSDGRHGARRPRLSHEADLAGHFPSTLLSSADYFVLMPNPRGSYGQGESFTRANVKDFGYGDLRDILAGVKEAVETLPVQPHRIGITG